jgi:alpha-beta hydrolase superfamily lysophospholipase
LFETTSHDTWIEEPGKPKLFARAWGDDRSAPAVGIIHGLGDHSGRWERVGRTLAEHGFAAYAIDLPGHGRSEGKRGHVRSWDDYRDAVRRWLEILRKQDGGRRWALFGHSMGALVALDWALRNPGSIDALVLSAPPFELSLRPAALKVQIARLIGLLWPGFTQGNQIPPSLLTHDPEVIRAHRADPYVHFRISARLFLELQAIRRSLAKAAGTLSIPTLLIQGQADPVTSCVGCSQWAKSAKPGTVTYREYPGLFHEVLNEPEGPAILEGIIAWLKQTLSLPRQAESASISKPTASFHPR